MTQQSSPFSSPSAIPFYPEYGLYNVRQGALRPWEFNGWQAESLSWKNGCYIHGGLSGPAQFVYSGRDAEKFLSTLCVNNFSKFKVGTAKHAVMCTDEGLIAAHGVLQRFAENGFRIFACGAWPLYMHSKTTLDVQQKIENNYLFQIAGPTSLYTLEAAAREDLRDIQFLRYSDYLSLVAIEAGRCN
jgi:glycine cleavage system aminomethyltransferase T